MDGANGFSIHSETRLAGHIEEVARENGISITWTNGSSTRGRAWRRTRRIRVAPIRSSVTYVIALHELGHILGKDGGRRLDKEAQAWTWARDNALVWDRTAVRTASNRIVSYLRWAKRRRGAWVPPLSHDAYKISKPRGGWHRRIVDIENS